MKVKLGEVCKVVSGGTPKTSNPAYWNETHCWITPAELNDDSYIIFESERKITDLAIKESGIHPFPRGTVLLSSRAPIGKVAIAGREMYCNQGFKNLICSESINPSFLYWFLKGKTQYLNALGRGATFKEISKGIVQEISLELPNIEKQRKIAQTLILVKKNINKRKAIVQRLDDLIKARFVEMFGDPLTNPKHWPVKKFPDVIKGKVSNGFFTKKENYNAKGNIAVLGVVNVVNRMYAGIENLPLARGTQKDIDNYSVKYGDLLFCRSSLVAEGIGKASIVPKNVQQGTVFECHVIRVPLDLEKCVPEFIQALTTTEYFRRQILSRAKTATMTTIGQKDILSCEIILPPLEQQSRYLEFIQQVDKSKFEWATG